MSTKLSDFDKKLLDSLCDLDDRAFERWKFFEERADNLRESLWTTGTWLLAILTAALTLPFVADLIKVVPGAFPLDVAHGLPVFLVAAFGLAFSLYAIFVLKDIKEHIETNWRKSNYIRTKETESSIDFRRADSARQRA